MIKTISFKPLGDERGSLFAIEEYKSVPFDIKRVYFLMDTKKGVSRGFHAHKNLKQVAICVTGSCRFVLDDGESREEIILASPTMGLIINDLTWREMHDFTANCVLMVIANQYYDELDYIRDYQEFLSVVREK